MADGMIEFPLWIEQSGLPLHLNETTKSPLAWLVFRKIVELDIATNRTPGTVEISLGELGTLVGLDAKKTEATLKKLRKGGVLRSFLPDNDEEPALFQVIAPLPTPVPWETVREQNPTLFKLPDHAFRYATGTEEAPPEKPGTEVQDPKLREVVDLYFSTVSMKMNAFIFDELRLIAARFDLPLIRKVFARARQKEVQTLGWILKEIRREQVVKKQGAESKVHDLYHE